ncbi:hypothetical protein CRYUN_Cryun14cG0067600 [Craigia yunnanensis]
MLMLFFSHLFHFLTDFSSFLTSGSSPSPSLSPQSKGHHHFDELTVEQRNLLSVAYKNVIGARCASWRIVSSIEQKEEGRENADHVSIIYEYRAKIEVDLSEICAGILKLINKKLVPTVGNGDSNVFYLKMKGDYHRYLAEFKTGDDRKAATENTLTAYKSAQAEVTQRLSNAKEVASKPAGLQSHEEASGDGKKWQSITVVEFYVFFAPFLGGHIWEYALVATYSLVALLVFILYVRCTVINAADPGIMSKFNGGTNKFDINHGLSVKDLARKFDEFGSGLHSSPSTVSRSSIAAPNSSKKGSVGDTGTLDAPAQSGTRKSCCIGGIFCSLFVHEDCHKWEGAVEQGSEDALLCTLCNAER